MGPARVALGAAALLLGGCPAAPAPTAPAPTARAGTAPTSAEAPEALAASSAPPAPSASPTPPPRDEPLTLAGLLASDPALRPYVRVEGGPPAPWLAAAHGRSLFLRAQGRCTELRPAVEGWEGDVRLCEVRDARGTTTCTRRVTLTPRGFRPSWTSCETKQPRAGGGQVGEVGGIEGPGGPPSWSLVAIDDDHAEVRPLYAIVAVAERHLLIRAPCEPGTAEAAFRNASGVPPRERDRQLYRTHGLTRGEAGRECRAVEGMRLMVENLGARRGAGGIGLTPVDQAQPVDCSRPCPEHGAPQLRAANALLHGLRFAKPGEPSATLYRRRALCEAQPTPGPAIGPTTGCAP